MTRTVRIVLREFPSRQYIYGGVYRITCGDGERLSLWGLPSPHGHLSEISAFFLQDVAELLQDDQGGFVGD